MKTLYKSKYDKGMKNRELSIERAREKFKNEYPKPIMSKFVFEPRVSRDGDIIDPAIVSYRANRVDSYDITSEAFLSNKRWVKALEGVQPDEAYLERTGVSRIIKSIKDEDILKNSEGKKTS